MALTGGSCLHICTPYVQGDLLVKLEVVRSTTSLYPPVPTGLSHFWLLVLRLACLSNVKVVFWHVFECNILQISVSGYKLVT